MSEKLKACKIDGSEAAKTLLPLVIGRMLTQASSAEEVASWWTGFLLTLGGGCMVGVGLEGLRHICGELVSGAELVQASMDSAEHTLQ